MKLSEAIRLGSMLKPQRFADGSIPDPNRACALEAAALAISSLEQPVTWAQLCCPSPERDLFPILRHRVVSCPAKGCLFPHDTMKNEIIAVNIYHLNDTHHWTRERIANWVEIQEQNLEAAQEISKPSESVLVQV